MKINLRKASALSAEIRNAAKNVSTEVSFSANLYSDNIQATAENMRVTLMENIVRKDRLDAVARAIRGLVGRANAEAGINDLLTEDSYLEALESRLKAFAHTKPMEDWTAFTKLIEARKAASAAGNSRVAYGGFDSSIDVPLLTSDDIAYFNNYLLEIRRRRREIKDRTVEINVRTEIEVSSDSEEILRQEGLI